MTFLQQVKVLIDEVGMGVFWTDAQLYDAANEALVEMAVRGKTQGVTVEVVVDQPLITIPSTILIPQRLVYNGVQYRPTTKARLEQWSKGWRGVAPALPQWFVVWDAEHLRAFPAPDQSYTFQLSGVPLPIEISAANTDIGLDPTYKLAVAYRTAANLLEHTLPDVADTYFTVSEEQLNRYKVEQRNYQPHRIGRIRPGTGYGPGFITLGREYR